jgi:hypothetical protein
MHGYGMDDENVDGHHIDVVTAEPDCPLSGDLVLSASAGDTVASIRGHRLIPNSTGLNTIQVNTTEPAGSGGGKVSGLHAIFPDYDAAIS